MGPSDDEVEFLSEPGTPGTSGAPGAPRVTADHAPDELDTGPRRALGRRTRAVLALVVLALVAAGVGVTLARHSGSSHPGAAGDSGTQLTVSGTPPVLNPPPPPGGHGSTIDIGPVSPVSCGQGEACGGDPTLPYAVTSALVEYVPDGALLSSETHRKGSSLVTRRIDLESADDGEVVIIIGPARSFPSTRTESGDDGAGTYARARIDDFLVSARASRDAPSVGGRASALQRTLLALVRDRRLVTPR